MLDPELPLRLTFKGSFEANELVRGIDQALEQVIWEQRVQEDGTVVVTILNIINLEEKAEEEDIDG